MAGDGGFEPCSRLRLRRPEGYPDYPNRPMTCREAMFIPFLKKADAVGCTWRAPCPAFLPDVRRVAGRPRCPSPRPRRRQRLSRRTGMSQDDFAVNNNGVLTLLNNATTRACVFLLTDSDDINAEGLCSVYEIRPKGCQTYPYVLNANDAAVLDDGCPHRDRFPEPKARWKVPTWCCSILRNASCVKDQPTEAPMNAFHMRRFGMPTASFHNGQ